MSIALAVTRGFGNGTFSGSIKDLVTAGFDIEALVAAYPLIITRGFGNGTFSGSIKDLVTWGYDIGDAIIVIGNPIDVETLDSSAIDSVAIDSEPI